jgi:hypothetical protein
MDFTIHYLPNIHIDLPFQSPLFRSEYYSFLFVKDGIGTYTIDEKEFNIKPNTFYFTNPGHIRSFQIDTCVDVYMLTVNEEFLIENLDGLFFDRFPFLLAEVSPPSYLTEIEFQQLEPIVKSIYSEFQVESHFKIERLANLFVALLLKIKAHYLKANNPFKEGSQNSKIVSSFKKLIESEFKKVSSTRENYIPLNVQDYANKLGLHPNYFNTVINRIY